MKNISHYRAAMLTILGDAGGRRYSEAVLDMGLKQALQVLCAFVPNKETVKIRVTKISGNQAETGYPPPGEILTIRDRNGAWLNGVPYRTMGKLYLNFYGDGPRPAAGDELMLEVAEEHTIAGLAGDVQTTVPENLMLTVCTGAAGYAMQIRARSVTEVFGKRPEDTENLQQQADVLITRYHEELQGVMRKSFFRSHPWPYSGFPI